MFSQNIPLTRNNILEYLETNFTNWTSGNEKINNFIQERQLKINGYDIVLEWIPYNQFNEIKETGKNGLITVYSAIWKDGPLHYQYGGYTRYSNKEVALKCFYKSQESIDTLINEAKKYPTKYEVFQVLYGISQNPDTGNYILVQNNSINLANQFSGNERIDDFVQERQLKINNCNDIVLEWIPYNQFNEIKETGKNGLITVYSAIWKNGPLCYNSSLLYHGNQYSNYNRDSNKEVALNCLYNSQEFIDSLINEAKKYSTKHKAFHVLYGISQNPNTGDYILVQNNSITLANQFSGNKKIDNFIQERQLKINNYDDTVLEWIPYNQFNEIKETGKNGLITVYSAIWKNGPLYYNSSLLYYGNKYSNYTRDSNKEVVLKCLYNSQESIDSLINKAKKYPIKHKAFQVLLGISQNPDTGGYILVQNSSIPLANQFSGNEKIDDFIQERQLKINNYNDIVVLEWIPHNQFNEIKEIGKNGLVTVYSAIWRDGPLYCNKQYKSYTRDSNREVALKYIYNSQESIDSLISEAKKYPTKYEEFQLLYGITQNPATGDYLFVQNNYMWTSGNQKIDDFIQERQLKINDYNNHDIVLEWIPYNQFKEIKETSKNGLITVYSAIWKDGPLCKKNIWSENYTRNSNKEVILKCFYNLQESIDSLINEAKKYPTKHKAFQVLYGISQNPDTGDYFFVQNNYIWTSGNEKIDGFIQERQLKINDYGYDNIVLEWIPYNQFNEIIKTGQNGLITVYSSIWKDGPLCKKNMWSKNYTRNSNKGVALKCLYNSQESIDSLINEAKKFPTKHKAFQVLYGISQNPDTGDYIFVQNNYIWTSGNEKIDDFIQKRQLKINDYNYNDIIIEWIPYNQFSEIKKTDFITTYSAIWRDGPLHYHHGEYIRDSNKDVILKCLYNSQESIDSLVNEAKKYSTKYKAFHVLYGISQNPNTGDYILIQNNSITLANQFSGNERIDDFIQERQLKINTYDDIVLEWIPYNQFNEIKKMGKNDLITVYSAIWKDGPLYCNKQYKSYTRDSDKDVVLNFAETCDLLPCG